MRQFDVFVFEENGPQFEQWKPSFEDPALGWFHDSDWNRPLQNIDAEWVVFAHPAITIDREFLNNLAQVIEGFPMVDAFAPRVRQSLQCSEDKNTDGKFWGGMLLNGSKGFASISENEKMRFVAAPNPLIGVYSSRIIQRTGLFDLDFRCACRLKRLAVPVRFPPDRHKENARGNPLASRESAEGGGDTPPSAGGTGGYPPEQTRVGAKPPYKRPVKFSRNACNSHPIVL
jgi:hypothetical protein